MDKIVFTDEILIQELKARFEEKQNSLIKLEKITKELTDVNDKLTESEALKSHFISNITNEIVNPFTSIVGLSKSILEVKEGDWKKVKRMAELIHTEAFNLDFQLKNIFAAAEIEAGELFVNVSNVKVDSLIDSLIEIYLTKAQNKSLIFEVIKEGESQEDAIFKTDGEKLKLILSNILDNSVKFSKNNKIIIKRLIDKGKLYITVQDFGIGISESNRKIIFDRFKRLDTGINSINRGHGLGLSINKALLDILEGDIEIESKEGKGSTFTIIVPEQNNSTHASTSDGNEVIFEDDEIFGDDDIF